MRLRDYLGFPDMRALTFIFAFFTSFSAFGQTSDGYPVSPHSWVSLQPTGACRSPDLCSLADSMRAAESDATSRGYTRDVDGGWHVIDNGLRWRIHLRNAGGGVLSPRVQRWANGCPQGYVQEAGNCILPAEQNQCEPHTGKWIGSGTPSDTPGTYPWSGEGSSTVPQTQCIAGCTVSRSTGDAVGFPSSNSWTFWGDFQVTGEACTPQEAEPEPEPADTPETECLKAGLGYGYVNGEVVCTKKPEDMVETKVETSETTDNITGEKTTTTKTTTKTGNTTTTTTETETRDADGNVINRGSSTTSTTGGGSGGAFVRPGRGSGSGSGNGDGDGDGECEGDNCEGQGGGSGSDGELYKKGERTVQDAFDDYQERISKAPIMNVMEGLFEVSTSGGTCPVFRLPSFEFLGGTLGGNVTIDAHCGWAEWHFAYYAIMFIALMAAIRIAFM